MERQRAKFPPPRQSIKLLDPVPDSAPTLVLELQDFVKLVRATCNGSAGGQSGLTSNHISPLLERADCMTALLRVFKLLIDGRFPAWMHPYVVQQKLIALGEKERPVCMGEWLMRTASSICNKTVDRETDQAFFVQGYKGRYAANFGTGAKGGAEVVTHVLNALLHEPESRNVCVSDDGMSAYNMTDRVNACNATTRQNPSTHRWINWLYGNAAMLGMRGVEGVVWGREGVLQGDPLGGRIHDTGLQKPIVDAVKRTAQKYPDQRVHVIAFRDDTYILGEATAALFCYEQFKLLRLEHTNVTTNVKKVFGYVSERACPTDRGEVATLDWALEKAREEVEAKGEGDTVVTDGFKAVGSPVSITPSFVDDFLTKAFNKYPNFLPRLKLMNIKTAIPLLRSTFLPIPTHLVRTTHPEYMRTHARAFDTAVFDVYKHITQDTQIQREDTRFSAPHNMGGLGFRSVEKTSPIAYFASVMSAMKVMSRIDDGLKGLVAHFKDPPLGIGPPDPVPQHIHDLMLKGLPGLLLEAWAVARREVFDHILSSSVSFPKTPQELFRMLASEVVSVDKLQHELCEVVEECWVEQEKGRQSVVEVARNQANAIRGASALLSNTPTPALLTMSDAAFRFSLQARLGHFEVPQHMCVCGCSIMSVDHIFSCHKLKGRFIRHDVIVALVCNMFKCAGLVAKTEVRVVNCTQKRMDIVVYTARGNYWIDVSIVNPLAPSYIEKKDPIEIREKHKRGKWQPHAGTAGVKFLPFVLNTMGGLGPSALSILQMVSSQAFINYPYAPAVKAGKWMASYRMELVQRIAVALAQLSYVSVEEAVVVAQGGETKGLFKGVFKYSKLY